MTDGSAATLPLPESVLRGYLGGAGLGTWLMHRLGPPGADPLAPGGPLAFVFSPLVGTPLTTSAKFAVVAKSPLTGMLTDALASSHFPIAGKLTGHDAIVIRGRAARLSVLLIDEDGARLADGGQLAGLTAAEAEARLRDDLGRGWRVAAIWASRTSRRSPSARRARSRRPTRRRCWRWHATCGRDRSGRRRRRTGSSAR